MLKAEVNTQVLEVYRRLKTLFKPKKKEISVTSLRNKRSSLVNSENKWKTKRNVLFL